MSEARLLRDRNLYLIFGAAQGGPGPAGAGRRHSRRQGDEVETDVGLAVGSVT